MANIFQFSFYRLGQPGVIAGLCIMALGIIVFALCKKINKYLGNLRVKKGKDEKDFTLILKCIALTIVLLGALLAVFLAY